MEGLTTLVERSRVGDLGAYGALVRRFQDMAVGYAQALTHDFHLAEDAAQEAFVRAYLDLGKLREPAAFPGWFRRIVFKQCDRITRRKGLPVVSLETVDEIGADTRTPDALIEEREIEDQVAVAVGSLPEHQRLVVNLFYISAFSHREIADFLGLSVQMVKNRLHAARKRLRQELIDMAKEELQEQRPSRDDTFVTHIMDELLELSDTGIQFLLRLIDQKDCVVALKGASDEVKETILGNMSERVRAFIEEEMEFLKDVEEEEIRRAQRTIMDNLRQIRHKPGKLSEEYRDSKRVLKERLQDKPVSRSTCEEIADLFAGLSSVVYEEGILALDEFYEIILQDEDDQLLGLGLNRAIAGVDPALNIDHLEKRMRLLVREQETRYRMIIEGIHLLQQRHIPAWVRTQLRAHYTLEDE